MKTGIGQWLQTKSKTSNGHQHRRQPALFVSPKNFSRELELNKFNATS